MAPSRSTNIMCAVAWNAVTDVRKDRVIVRGQIARGAQFWMQVMQHLECKP